MGINLPYVAVIQLVAVLTNSVAQELEGLSTHTQQLATGLYTEPVESNPHLPANLPKIHSDPIILSKSWSWSSDLSLSFGH
jgi:hypothetical protein